MSMKKMFVMMLMEMSHDDNHDDDMLMTCDESR